MKGGTDQGEPQGHPSIQLHQAGDVYGLCIPQDLRHISTPCLDHQAGQALAFCLCFLPYFPRLQSAEFLTFPNSCLAGDISLAPSYPVTSLISLSSQTSLSPE